MLVEKGAVGYCLFFCLSGTMAYPIQWEWGYVRVTNKLLGVWDISIHPLPLGPCLFLSLPLYKGFYLVFVSARHDLWWGYLSPPDVMSWVHRILRLCKTLVQQDLVKMYPLHFRHPGLVRRRESKWSTIPFGV